MHFNTRKIGDDLLTEKLIESRARHVGLRPPTPWHGLAGVNQRTNLPLDISVEPPIS